MLEYEMWNEGVGVFAVLCCAGEWMDEHKM